MGRKKKKWRSYANQPAFEEENQPTQPIQVSTPKEEIPQSGIWHSLWAYLKSKALPIKEFIFMLEYDKGTRYLIEDLSAWVFVKRLLIVVDNIIAAGLFGFFSIWINNYLGYNAESSLVASVQKTINDIAGNFSAEAPYFALYLFMFWRAPRLTRLMPREFYINRSVKKIIALIVLACFLMIGVGYLFNVGKVRSDIMKFPFIVTFLRWSIFLSLAFYRRIYALLYINTWLKNHTAESPNTEGPQQPDSDEEIQPTQGESSSNGNTEQGISRISSQKGGFISKLKHILTFFNLSNYKYAEYQIEEMSAWVAIKRFLIVVDNVIAAGLFCVLVSWTGIYLTPETNLDLCSSVIKSINDITLNFPEELPYFLFYLFMFWRAPRITKKMPLNYYFDKEILKICLYVLALLGIIILGVCSDDLRYHMFGIEHPHDGSILISSVRISVFLLLFIYRRIILWTRVFTWYEKHPVESQCEK